MSDSIGPFSELMQRLRDRDPDAEAEVFQRYARRLVGLAASRLPDHMRAKFDAEDVVQSAFNSFFQRQAAGQFELDGWDNLWTMLTVITVRKCGHRLEQFHTRRRDVRREVTLGSTSDDDSRPGRQVADPEPTPSEVLALEETIEQVTGGLKATDQPILLLKLQGYTNEEVADLIGRSERHVYRVLERIRHRLERLQERSDP